MQISGKKTCKNLTPKTGNPELLLTTPQHLPKPPKSWALRLDVKASACSTKIREIIRKIQISSLLLVALPGFSSVQNALFSQTFKTFVLKHLENINIWVDIRMLEFSTTSNWPPILDLLKRVGTSKYYWGYRMWSKKLPQTDLGSKPVTFDFSRRCWENSFRGYAFHPFWTVLLW